SNDSMFPFCMKGDVMNMMKWETVNESIQIKTPAIFDFQKNLAFLQRNPNECMYTIQDGALFKLYQIGELLTFVKITSPNNTFLLLTFLTASKQITPSEKDAIVGEITDWFDLKRNL